MRWLVVVAALALSCGRDQVLLLGGEDDGDGGLRKDGFVPDPGDGPVDDRDVPRYPDVPSFDGGMGECNRPRDCRDLYGDPPFCPNGNPSVWDCSPQGFCTVECLPDQCFDDCDCDPFLACINGSCQPAGRRNLCCTSPECPTGAECIEPGGGRGICPGDVDAGLPRDGGFRPDGGRDGGVIPDAGMPETPVGDPCASQFMCGPIGFCIEEENGFPDGYCSQDCGPAGEPCPPGAVCKGFDMGNAICLDACSSNAECRSEYVCVQVGLDPQRVCWPTPGGSNNPNGNAVGGECGTDDDCATGLQCLSFQGWPGGYCTKQFCDPMTNPCPGGSSCFNFPGFFSLCLDDCPIGGTQSDCRPGYYCLGPTGQPGGCLPN